MINHHQNVIHHHIQETIILEISRDQKWQFIIGHYQISQHKDVFYVFGKLNKYFKFQIKIFFRYNISTADYDGWNTDAKSNGNQLYVMKE